MDFSNSSNVESELYQAQIHLYKHVNKVVSCMALKSATELGIADAIHNHGKPMTLSELASVLKLHPSKVGILHRFMRLLAHDGFFTKTKQKGKEEEIAYALTLPSKLLIKSNNSSCLAFMVLAVLHPLMINIWNSATKLLTEDTELPLFDTVTGKSFWDYVHGDFDLLSLFQESMAADSQMMKLGIKECKHVFEGLDSLVDVGGGTGGVSRLIHEVFPHLKCTVLDQPHVVANLNGTENLNFVGGDMFKSIPSAYAVLLKWILHDWNDELSLKIVKNCKEAISKEGKKGKIIITDIVIDEAYDNGELTELKLEYDLTMLTMLNGKEREKKEWEKLIYDAGFSSYKISPVFGFKSLIEVYP